ncbi:hypothetical protein Hsero_3196 [Herbaspirillum seropedicae SmR1]|uniref:Uncharacterized protein n=1 Tax=Herbaspirillum seropedicae (strain SmR1) TaxID=757424 RepID=D8J1A9_HERSS|nr:hypothetical protein Hsero_3196 [Herbaspirillum seropedicae SmR1]
MEGQSRVPGNPATPPTFPHQGRSPTLIAAPLLLSACIEFVWYFPPQSGGLPAFRSVAGRLVPTCLIWDKKCRLIREYCASYIVPRT